MKIIFDSEEQRDFVLTVFERCYGNLKIKCEECWKKTNLEVEVKG